MKVQRLLWKEQFVHKIIEKHGVDESEVEEVLFSTPHIRRAKRGHVKGEDVYLGYGQTDSGRYLLISFIWKGQGLALPISARDMSRAERRYFDEQTEST